MLSTPRVVKHLTVRFFQSFTYPVSTVSFWFFFSLALIQLAHAQPNLSTQNIYKLAQAKIAIPKGADINKVTEEPNKWTELENETALHLAIEDNNLAAAVFLLLQGADVNCASDIHPYDAGTALHYASTPEAVKLLLDCGADLDSQEVFGHTTPIYEAVVRQDEAVVNFFLKKGADVNCGAVNNQNVLYFMARGLIWLLFDCKTPLGSPENKTFADLFGENLPSIAAVATFVGLYPKEEWTLLSLTQVLAAFTTSFSTFAGAKAFNLCNQNNHIQNHVKKYLSLCIMPVKNAANLPLNAAIASKNKALIETLIREGADVNGCGEELKTPLVDTIFHYRNHEEEGIEILKLLIAQGANIHQQYNIPFVTYEYNLEHSEFSYTFTSALQLARILNCDKMADFLRQQGAEDKQSEFDIQNIVPQLPHMDDFASWQESIQDFFTINTNGAQLRYGKIRKKHRSNDMKAYHNSQQIKNSHRMLTAPTLIPLRQLH